MAEIVVGGAACRCTQGSAPCALDIVANSRTIGGKTIANENDAQSCLDGFGFCEILSDINEEQTPCDPSKILKMWVGCDERFFGCGELSAIITTSVLFCTVGGVIFIVESGQVGENKVTNVGEMRLNYAEDMFEVIMGIARLSYRVRGEGPMSHAGGVQELPPIDAGMVLYNLFRYYSSNRDRLDAIEFSEGSMLGLIVYNLARVYGLREKVQNATYNQILAGEPGGLWFVANSPIVAIYEFDANTTQTIRAEIVVDIIPTPPGGRRRVGADYVIESSEILILTRERLDNLLGFMGIPDGVLIRNQVNTNLGIGSAPLLLSNMMNSRIAMATGFVYDPDPDGSHRRRESWGTEIAYVRKTVVNINIFQRVMGEEQRINTNRVYGYLVDETVYPECLERLFNSIFLSVGVRLEFEVNGNVFTVRPLPEDRHLTRAVFERISIILVDSTASLNGVIVQLQRHFQHNIVVRDSNPTLVELVFQFPEIAPVRRAGIRVHGGTQRGSLHEVEYVNSRIRIPDMRALRILCDDMGISNNWTITRNRLESLSLLSDSLLSDPDASIYLDELMNERLSTATGFVRAGDSREAERNSEGMDIIANLRKTAVDIRVIHGANGRLITSEHSLRGYSVNGTIFIEDLEDLHSTLLYMFGTNGNTVRLRTLRDNEMRFGELSFNVTNAAIRLRTQGEMKGLVDVLEPQILCSVETLDTLQSALESHFNPQRRGFFDSDMRDLERRFDSETLFIFTRFHRESIRFIDSVHHTDLYPWDYRVVQVTHDDQLGLLGTYAETVVVEDFDRIRSMTAELSQQAGSTVYDLITAFTPWQVNLPIAIGSNSLSFVSILFDHNLPLEIFEREFNRMFQGQISATVTFIGHTKWRCYKVYIWDLRNKQWKFGYLVHRYEHEYEVRSQGLVPAVYDPETGVRLEAGRVASYRRDYRETVYSESFDHDRGHWNFERIEQRAKLNFFRDVPRFFDLGGDVSIINSEGREFHRLFFRPEIELTFPSRALGESDPNNLQPLDSNSFILPEDNPNGRLVSYHIARLNMRR